MLSSRAFSPRIILNRAALSPLVVSTRFFASPTASTTTSTMTGNISVADAVKHDHRELEQYYDHIINATDADTKTRYQNLFTWELARHSVGEELVVYPALEKYVDGGKALADRDREEHQKVHTLP